MIFFFVLFLAILGEFSKPQPSAARSRLDSPRGISSFALEKGMHPPWWLLAALAAALAPPSADAWTPKLAPAASAKSTFGPSSSTRLFSTPDPAPSSGDPNSVYRTFINQCSVQSFMFLLKTTRDPYSIRWLDNFTMPAIRPGGRDHQPQPLRCALLSWPLLSVHSLLRCTRWLHRSWQRREWLLAV